MEYIEKSSDKEEKNERSWFWATFWAVLTIIFVKTFCPHVIPLPAFSLWDSKTSLMDWLAAGAPLFAWGLVIQTIFEARKKRETEVERLARRITDRLFGRENPKPTRVFFGGILVSAWAGFAEEISFRWVIFLSSIVWVKVANFIFLGFIDINIVAWFHNNVWGPIANFATLGKLTDLLYHPSGWALGAAMLSSNAFFRDGHKYQGLFGLINSWFIGMFLFWVAFHHGLWAGILIHFLYDVIVFSVAAIGLSLRDD